MMNKKEWHWPAQYKSLMKGVDIKKEYGGRYDIMDGVWLVLMRRVIEGEIEDEETIEFIKEGFAGEFPESAIETLRKDAEEDSYQ